MGPRVDVLLGIVERFDPLAFLRELVGRDLGVERNAFRHPGPNGLLLRDEHSDHAVIADEVAGNGVRNILRADLLQAVAVEEKEPPVAHSDEFRELDP